MAKKITIEFGDGGVLLTKDNGYGDERSSSVDGPPADVLAQLVAEITQVLYSM
jgi:hypothetical protein